MASGFGPWSVSNARRFPWWLFPAAVIGYGLFWLVRVIAPYLMLGAEVVIPVGLGLAAAGVGFVVREVRGVDTGVHVPERVAGRTGSVRVPSIAVNGVRPSRAVSARQVRQVAAPAVSQAAISYQPPQEIQYHLHVHLYGSETPRKVIDGALVPRDELAAVRKDDRT